MLLAAPTDRFFAAEEAVAVGVVIFVAWRLETRVVRDLQHRHNGKKTISERLGCIFDDKSIDSDNHLIHTKMHWCRVVEFSLVAMEAAQGTNCYSRNCTIGGSKRR